MSARRFVSVFFASHVCFTDAVDPICVAGEAGCTSDIDDAASLLATRVERRDESRFAPHPKPPKPDKCPFSDTMCSGNQCCPGAPETDGKTYPCPSATDTTKCEVGPPGPPKHMGCIQTPQEWFDTFNANEFRCVSPKLFGAINTADTLFPYHPLAFLSGSANLENFLSVNKYFRHAQKNGTIKEEDADIRITAAFAVLVGFPKSFIKIFGTLEQIPFTVFLLPAPGTAAVVPSWEQLFLILEDFGLEEVDFSVTRDLTLAYSHGKDTIDSFCHVTGCNRKLVEKFVLGDGDVTIEDAKCNKTFYAAIEATGVNKLDEDKRPGGVPCFFNFQKAVKNKKIPVDATTLRALFYTCIDANPLFTGLGLGFNNVASPLVTSGPTKGEDFYTGREFVSPNLPLDGINQVSQNLPFPKTKDPDLAFLNPKVGFYVGCKHTPIWEPRLGV